MVRNPGLIPGLESIRAGDVGARRKNMYEMMVGLYSSSNTKLMIVAGSLVLAQARVLILLSSRTLSSQIPLPTPIFTVLKNSASLYT